MCLGSRRYGRASVGDYYYAFGMEMEGERQNGVGGSEEHRYRYNGK